MTEEAALQALKNIIAGQQTPYCDEETDHGNADAILCEFLTHLGYSDIVDAFDEIRKWYA
jgi:hypothetical protein